MAEKRFDEAPAIGTTEAAVRSSVKLMSMLFEQPEEYVAYFLDLYYQVRCAYEREHAAPAAEAGIRKEELYPMLRELLQEALRGNPGGRSGKRRVAEVEAGPYQRGAPLPPEGEADGASRKIPPAGEMSAQRTKGGRTPSPTDKPRMAETPGNEEGEGAAAAAPPKESRDRGDEDPAAAADAGRLQAGTRADEGIGPYETSGASRKIPPAGEMSAQRTKGGRTPPPAGRGNPSTADAVPLPLGKGGIAGDGGKRPGPWTVFKRNVVRKLETARAGGLTYARIAATSHGALTEAEVMAALSAGKLPQDKRKALDAPWTNWKRCNTGGSPVQIGNTSSGPAGHLPLKGKAKNKEGGNHKNMCKMIEKGLVGLAPRRARAGFTQQAFADRLGVSRALVAMWETGAAWPSARMLPEMADLLVCCIDELYEPLREEEGT